jgi:hypothetical protein
MIGASADRNQHGPHPGDIALVNGLQPHAAPAAWKRRGDRAGEVRDAPLRVFDRHAFMQAHQCDLLRLRPEIVLDEPTAEHCARTEHVGRAARDGQTLHLFPVDTFANEDAPDRRCVRMLDDVPDFRPRERRHAARLRLALVAILHAIKPVGGGIRHGPDRVGIDHRDRRRSEGESQCERRHSDDRENGTAPECTGGQPAVAHGIHRNP